MKRSLFLVSCAYGVAVVSAYDAGAAVRMAARQTFAPFGMNADNLDVRPLEAVDEGAILAEYTCSRNDLL